jgi:poly(hydroxyalkanoate) depolymerase family esterase
MSPVFARLLREARAFAQRNSMRGARAVLQQAWDDARRGPWRQRVLEPARFDAARYSGPEGARDYKVFVPAGDAQIARPLVLMLHGCGQDPDDFAAGTRMNEHAQEHGLVVLYPAQATRSNHQRCWNWFMPGDQHRDAGEPALLAGMTRHVMALHGVDPARVYVAGLSAGAAMADILAHEYPDLYAAAGIHSGVPHGAAHDMASAFAAMQGHRHGSVLHATLGWWLGVPPVAPPAPSRHSAPRVATPTIVFHGDADDTVHPRNGDGVIGALLERADAEIAASSVTASCGGRSVTRTVHRRAGASSREPSVAEHWVVHGAGHAWSGGDPAGSHADALGPDATREMLRFFAEHPRVVPAPRRFALPVLRRRALPASGLASPR